MNVKLISYSQVNVFAFDSDSGDDYVTYPKTAQDLVAFCARVSNPSNQYNTQTSERLIQYLIQHKHWSPMEMVSMCLEIETTRDIARQFLRHRSFSFQEFSQRYADPVHELSFVIRDARLQDKENRQNSIDVPPETKDENGHDLAITWQQHQENIISYAKAVYEYAIRNGIAKEQARVVLPEGLMASRLYVNGTLRSWLHYVEVRSAKGTQKEHIEIAKACANVISKIFPMITNFVEKN